MVIIKHLKNIVKHSFRLLLIVVLSTFATSVASAKTINGNTQVLDDSRYDYFYNLYKRSDYKNYLLSIEYVNNGSYNYYTYYYICLTNDDINITNSINASSNCEEMYRWNYRSSTDNSLEKINDSTLSVTNSVYYTNDSYDKRYVKEKVLITISIGIFTFFLSYVLLKIFRS